jgi:preprotein translocase subunit YajC
MIHAIYQPIKRERKRNQRMQELLEPLRKGNEESESRRRGG